jgi:flagellar biogenesis protein FliO
MARAEPIRLQPTHRKSWGILSGIGLLAVMAGLLVPAMGSGVAPLPEAPAAAKGKAADGNLAYTPPAWPEAPDPKAMLLRLAIGTGVVLLLCVVTLVAGKRWFAAVAPGPRGASPLTLVDSLALGNRCAVHLVRVGRCQVLIGTDGTGLQTVVPLQEPFEVALEELHDPAPAAPEPAAPNQAA